MRNPIFLIHGGPVCIADIHNADVAPHEHGHYLVLVYEWVGLPNKKPSLPEWTIKYYSGKWPKQHYYSDTGGYENLEVVAWMALPQNYWV